MHPTKRRKLRQSGGFLNKPFRSPLRSTNPQPQPSAEQAHIQVPAAGVSSDLPRPPLDSKPDIPSLLQRSSMPRSSFPLIQADSGSRDLQKQHTALSIRLTQLRQSLQAAEEALQIEGSKQNVELKALMSRWRTVAQDAAEELFADAKERVDRMGGIAQWRRQLQEDSHLWKNDDMVPSPRRCADNIEDDDCQGEAEEIGQVELAGCESDTEPEENSFTMETMLKQMNIDLQCIGFDKHQERWM